MVQPNHEIAYQSFSFVVENRQVLDVVKSLDGRGIAVRGGDLASLPPLRRMGVTGAVRASYYAYTASDWANKNDRKALTLTGLLMEGVSRSHQ